MIIDGGTKSAVSHLRDRLEQLEVDDREIDLLVVTHIDLDHIEAPIELLRAPVEGVTFNDVWFNDYRHLVPPAASTGTTRGGIQGEFLSALLEIRNLAWNTNFGGEAVVVPDEGPLPRIDLPGGLTLVLLSPTPDKLADLAPDWNKAVEEADLTPGDRARVQQLLEKRMGEIQPTRGGKTWGKDGSSANGSSIAFIAEYGEERWLLSGDAHDDALRSGLERYASETKQTRVKLTGFKVPHHGSVSNMSSELLDAIDCQRFLISSNGSYFKHPDKDCVDLIVEKTDGPRLDFNYLTEFTKPWQNVAGVSATYLYDDEHQLLTSAQLRTESEVSPPSTEAASASAVASKPSPSVASHPGSSPQPPDATKFPRKSLLTDPILGADNAGSIVIEPNAAALQPVGGRETTSVELPSDPQPIVEVEGSPAQDVADLAVSIVHGSIDRADAPVLMGHYVATPLDGTEQFVDSRYDRRLSERHILGQYPGPIGTHRFVRPPRERQPAMGALIVGLGEYGELTPLRLTETVRAALVSHALDRVDTDSAERRLEISSVLVGATGDEGLGVRSAVRSIVRGVVEANRSLVDDDGSSRCQYVRLRLWERQAVEAELALAALADDACEGSEVETADFLPASARVSPILGRTRGALRHGIPRDLDQRPWSRLSIHASGQQDDPSMLELQVSTDGRLAGVGTRGHGVERDRLNRILSEASRDPASQPGLYTTLFEQLLPNELKSHLGGAADIQLDVDLQTASIPWEMLEARGPRGESRQPLALRAPITRKLKVELRESPVRASNPTALVIGNPPAGAGWPTLPGAFNEAAAVAAVLAGSSQIVTSKTYEPDHPDSSSIAREVETVICADAYRIMHIAGHGAFDPNDPSKTGILIGDSSFITATFLSRLHAVPDLVFLNCCHLGKMGPTDTDQNAAAGEFHRLGASLAAQLIQSGVRAVVAAGWAVEDSAAVAFATTFYEQMTRAGATFGAAAFAARQAAYRASPDSSTWGAYQCYGDSGLTLSLASTTGAPRVPTTVREAMRRIEVLVDHVDSVGASASATGRDWALEELLVIDQAATEQQWERHADGALLAEQLGGAFADIEWFSDALRWYDLAIAHPSSLASFRAYEQRANLRGRHAIDVLSSPHATDQQRAEAEADADKARTDIELLLEMGESKERRRLLAGHHKRRAVMTEGEERYGHLTEAVTAYQMAYELEKADNGDKASPDELFTAVQLDAVRKAIKPRSRAVVAKWNLNNIDASLKLVNRLRHSEQNFWLAVGRADGLLAKSMVEGTIGTKVGLIVRLYKQAYDQRSTGRQRNSSADHVADLVELHPAGKQRDGLASIAEKLRAELRSARSED